MSFAGPDIIRVTEALLVAGARAAGAPEPSLPFPHMTHAEATSRFGSDRPDTRFGLEIVELTELMASSQARVLAEAVAKGGMVGGIVADEGSRLSRRELDELVAWAPTVGAKGLAWIRATEEGWQSPLAKFFSEGEREKTRAKQAAPAVSFPDRGRAPNRCRSSVCGFAWRRCRPDP
jgi:aspartyl-tRNA synthetase